jgi:dTDP-4-dehydrorhamnose reductase
MKGLILVIGSEGLVGSRFVETSERKNFLHLPKEVELDITDRSDIQDILTSYSFSAVVNFAAFTDVNKAEEERGDKNGKCWQVNVEGVKNLAEAIKPHKGRIHFIQISTDMVFSGSVDDPGPYREDHEPEKDLDKVTWYGYTKGEGERFVKEALGEKATVLRIIYPVRAKFDRKLDYIRKPLSLYDEGKLYPLFSDQQISITYIDEACRALDKIITESVTGTFHAGSSNTTTPFNLISKVIERTRGVSNVASPIALDNFLKEKNFPKFRYPRMGGLSVEKSEQQLGLKFSNWEEIVEILVSQGLGK